MTNEPKHELDYNQDNEKMISLNVKIINILFCALDSTKFNRVSTCESVKKVWTILQTTHKGISQVKESNIELLFREYELFEIKSRETMINMCKWFSKLVNYLKGLEKRFETIELVKKILSLLTNTWNTKVMTIEESKDLSKIDIDKLIGSMLTYKMKRKPKDEETKVKRDIALEVIYDKEEDGSSSMDEEDTSLIARKFSKFLSRSKRSKKRSFLRPKRK